MTSPLDAIDGGNRDSLKHLSLETILLSQEALEYAIKVVPLSVHKMLLHCAASLLQSDMAAHLSQSIITLIANWPMEELNLMQILSDSGLHTSFASTQFLQLLMQGLLIVENKAALQIVNCLGYHAPVIFQMPLLALDTKKRTIEGIKQCMQESLGINSFFDEENIENMLQYKLDEILEKNYKCSIERIDPIILLVESQINMSEVMLMDDEILGLVVQNKTPFRLKVRKLSIDNFHTQETRYLKWLLNLIDKENMEELMVYGHQKSISMFVWELWEDLVSLSNMRVFGMGTSGPRMLWFCKGTSEDDIADRTAHVFRAWKNLQELHLVGIDLTNQLQKLLSQLQSSLLVANFRACHLSEEDIIYLSKSHHAKDLCKINLEGNRLAGMADSICELVKNAPNISLLILGSAALRFGEKLAVVRSLRGYPLLSTLAICDGHNIPNEIETEQIMEEACHIPNLEFLYIYPIQFRYPKSTLKYTRKREMCQKILEKYGKASQIKVFF